MFIHHCRDLRQISDAIQLRSTAPEEARRRRVRVRQFPNRHHILWRFLSSTSAYSAPTGETCCTSPPSREWNSRSCRAGPRRGAPERVLPDRRRYGPTPLRLSDPETPSRMACGAGCRAVGHEAAVPAGSALRPLCPQWRLAPKGNVRNVPIADVPKEFSAAGKGRSRGCCPDLPTKAAARATAAEAKLAEIGDTTHAAEQRQSAKWRIDEAVGVVDDVDGRGPGRSPASAAPQGTAQSQPGEADQHARSPASGRPCHSGTCR